MKLRAYPGELVAEEAPENRLAVFLTRKNIFSEKFTNRRGTHFVRRKEAAIDVKSSCWVPVFLSPAVLNVWTPETPGTPEISE